MSISFISHSSRDKSVASELRDELRKWGYESVFLDFDPDQGIPVGRDWERELYRRLETCRALVAVLSADSVASRWCFAEVTQAKALGKPIFPLKTAPCRIEDVLTDRQVIDLTGEREAGYRRLRRGLELAGLAPNFAADPSRSPYPGLSAFSAADAAFFFGRDDEVAATLESLAQMRRRGEPRFLLVLGASGSGKSSLIRAGVLPRLERDSDRWLVVPPFRPGDRPAASAARALSELFRRLGKDRDWRAIRDQLCQERESWPELCADLSDLAGAREASVLLVVDQLEEALTGGQPALEDPLLPRLLGEGAGGVPLVLATLRSDFLNIWQRTPGVESAEFATVPLGPMPSARLPLVIEGPAQLQGLEFEPGLVQRIISDTASGTALPLLAFTLRELYERCRDRERLELTVYERELGGIEGSVGRVATQAIQPGSLEAEAERALREAFLRMVRVNEEGQYARRSARWDDLSRSAHPLLERLIDSRLLLSRGEGEERHIEVAHEALFTAWPTLEQWLDEERSFLLWRRRLKADRVEWEHHGEDSGSLLQGAALAEARSWVVKRKGNLEVADQGFLDASLEKESRRRRRRWTFRLGAGLVALILLGLGAWALRLQRRGSTTEKLAAARDLAIKAELIRTEEGASGQLRALLATEALQRFVALGQRSAEADVTLRRALRLLPSRLESYPHRFSGAAVAFGPEPHQLTVNSVGKMLAVIDRRDGTVTEHLHRHSGVQQTPRVALSDDGRFFAAAVTGTADDPTGAAYLWGAGRPDPIARFPFEGQLRFLAVAWDTGHVAVTGRRDEATHVYRPDGTSLGTVPGKIRRAAFSSSGRHLAVGGSAESAGGPGGGLWRIDEGRTPALTLLQSYPEDDVFRVFFSSGGDYFGRVATRDYERYFVASKLDSRNEGKRLPIDWGLGPFALSAGGRYLAMADDGAVYVYRLDTGQRVRIDFERNASVGALRFHPERDELAVAGFGIGVQVWRLTSGTHVAETQGAKFLEEIRLVSDSKRTLLVSLGWGEAPSKPAGDRELEFRVFDVARGQEITELRVEDRAVTATLTPDGAFLLTADLGGTVNLRGVTGGAPIPFQHEGTVDVLGLSHDRRLLAAAGDGEVSVWALPEGHRRSLEFPEEARVRTLELGPAGRFLVVEMWETWDKGTRGERSAWVEHTYDLDTGGELTESDQGRREANRLAIVAETSRAYRTGNTDPETVTVWTRDGELYARIEDAGPIELMAADTEGRYLAASTPGGLIRVWPLAHEDLIDMACARLWRQLSDQERREYLPEEDDPGPVCPDRP